jgi:hypothetical protein
MPNDGQSDYQWWWSQLRRKHMTTLTPGQQVRIKTDTEWEGIPLEAGAVCKVTSIQQAKDRFDETAWVVFEPEGAQAELDTSLLEPVRRRRRNKSR